MPVTLKEIAHTAGVSIKTVSNVVNGRAEHYSPATQARVLQAAARLGYTPNPAARHLRGGRTGMLALVLPDILNPYFGELATHVIGEAERLGYTVQVAVTLGDAARERRILAGPHRLAVDGILLDSVGTLDAVDAEEERVHPPAVLLGEQVWGGAHDHVVIDNVAAAYAATAHLVGLGRRRIALIGAEGVAAAGWPGPGLPGPGLPARTTGAPEPAGMAALRLRGYLDALAAAGLEPPAHRAGRLGLAVAPTYDRAHGAAALRSLLALPQPPDAVFCCSDVLALGALAALADAGLRVPADVAVVGVDDIAEAAYSRPPLSTIAPDKAALARCAVALLVDRIEGRRVGPGATVYAPFTLVARASTAATVG